MVAAKSGLYVLGAEARPRMERAYARGVPYDGAARWEAGGSLFALEWWIRPTRLWRGVKGDPEDFHASRASLVNRSDRPKFPQVEVGNGTTVTACAPRRGRALPC